MKITIQCPGCKTDFFHIVDTNKSTSVRNIAIEYLNFQAFGSKLLCSTCSAKFTAMLERQQKEKDAFFKEIDNDGHS